MSHSESYRLTELEREYLSSGETGTYSEAELRRRIQEKQDRIGSRFQNLVRDLSLMYRSEFYDYEDNNRDIFTDLDLSWLKESLDIVLLRGDPSKELHDPEWGRLVTTPETQEEFGYLLGGFLCILFDMMQDNRSWDRTLRGLFHFYLMGSGKKLSAKIENKRKLYRRYNKLKELITFEQVEEIPASDSHHRIYTNDEYTYMTEIEFTGEYAPMDVIEEILEEKGIPSAGFIEKSITTSYAHDSSTVYLSTRNMVLEKLSNYYDDPRFNKTMEIYKFAMTDKKYLENEWRGPNRIDIIEEVFLNSGKIKSSKIANNLGQSSSAHLVTNALDQISEDTNESERWTSYPATKKHEDGWELLPYGHILGLLITGNEFEIERFALPHESCLRDEFEVIISNSLEQINEN